MANKVEFGISNLYVGTYTEGTSGSVTMGTPYHQAGAVSFAPEESSERNVFHADNTEYYASYTGGTFEGDLTVALFDDKFKKDFLGYLSKADGGIAQVKNATKPKVYVAFQVEGDDKSRRVIMYNCSFGSIKREFNTTEESKEVATETIAVSVTGNNQNGVSMVSYLEGVTGYNTLFTNPPAPTTT